MISWTRKIAENTLIYCLRKTYLNQFKKIQANPTPASWNIYNSLSILCKWNRYECDGILPRHALVFHTATHAYHKRFILNTLYQNIYHRIRADKICVYCDLWGLNLLELSTNLEGVWNGLYRKNGGLVFFNHDCKYVFFSRTFI